MVSNRMLFRSVLVFGLCSMAMAILADYGPPTPSFILGGDPNYDTENDNYDMNCSQYQDDFDVLRHFPFPVRVNPGHDEFDAAIAQLTQDKKAIRMMWIREGLFLPSIAYCFSNISDLSLDRMPLKDGALPEVLKKMQNLRELDISNMPDVHIGDLFLKMPKLRSIGFTGCSLSTFPDVSHMELSSLSLQGNALHQLSGPVDVHLLSLDHNQFQTLPIVKHPEKLLALYISHNPISNIAPILAYTNLTLLSLSNTNVTVIPPGIDRLQELELIDLANTNIAYLPTSILNLPKLEYLNIKNTLISPAQIQSITRAFQLTHPNLYLDV